MKSVAKLFVVKEIGHPFCKAELRCSCGKDQDSTSKFLLVFLIVPLKSEQQIFATYEVYPNEGRDLLLDLKN